MSTVVTFPVAHKRTATISALLCGDDLTKLLQRAVLAHMAAFGSGLTLLEIDRTMIKAQMQHALDGSSKTD